jgi:cytochrome c5
MLVMQGNFARSFKILAQALIVSVCLPTMALAEKVSQDYPVGERGLFTERATTARLAPSAKVCLVGDAACAGGAGVQLAAAGATKKTPQDIYNTSCAMCHSSGMAGAPKSHDVAAWKPRLAVGIDALTASAIKGKGAMPPKGTCMTCSDADIKAVVQFMVK